MTVETQQDLNSAAGGASVLTEMLEVSAAESAWSRSLVEEVIGVLWVLAAILCFGFGFHIAGFCFAAKAILDNVTSIGFGIREAIEERKRKTSNAELSGPRPLAAEGSRSNDVLGAARPGKD